MKNSMDAMEKVRKRKAAKSRAPPPKQAVAKKPRVALGAPTASTRAPPVHHQRSSDDEVEVISPLIPMIPVSAIRPIPSTGIA